MHSVFDDVQILTKKYFELWESSASDISFLEEYTPKQKKSAENEICRAIYEITDQIDSLPADIDDKEWQGHLKGKIAEKARMFLKIKNKDFETLMINGFLDSTDDFISKARKFDENLNFEDIYQAMRNVWIMNIIQVTANKKIACTPSVFAYSMLYPYTDNYLDDPEISVSEKEQFNKRLRKRLEGEKLEPVNKHEMQIYELIGIIESEYNREKYPKVFESILCIHAGQCKSLEQQDLRQNTETQDILNISIEKGGTSVLADAYLACGNLDETLADIMFGFGFVLQLVDDLQDTKVDFENNHITIFSKNIKKVKLDFLTSRLISLAANTLDFSSYNKSPYTDSIKKLIMDNTLLLIFEAIWQSKNLYTRKYIKNIQKNTPFSYKVLHRKMKKQKNKFKSIENKYNLLYKKEV